MITDHLWRAPHAGTVRGRAARLARMCEYMNCRRPRDEHARSTSRGWS